VSETKLPWKAFGPYDNGFMSTGYLIVTDYDVHEPEPEVGMFDGAEPLHGPNSGFTKEDAEFIVRACNSHYQLLEACKSLLPILEAVRYTAGLGKTQMERVEKARAAIALASNPHAAERE
jgi:hypothetical protein